jgi:putative membrane protein
MKDFIYNFLKGMGMGAANVIPGVSGGTIALITGIFERLINSIKSFNLTALKLFFTGKWKAFAEHVDLKFLVAVFLGIAAAILSVAKLFKFLFENYPVYIWAFFFGLIIASIYYVGRTVNKWNLGSILFFAIGTGIALLIAFGTPAQENHNFLYLILCGVVGTCSMILPGLSGSYVLLLMGNYEYVMIDAVNLLTTSPWEGIKILIPVVIGAVIGLLAFAHLLSWIFKNFHDQTVALLTGFILGSTPIIWPWKHAITNALKDGTEKVVGYQWQWPAINTEFFIALVIMLLGAAIIIVTEQLASKKEKQPK